MKKQKATFDSDTRFKKDFVGLTEKMRKDGTVDLSEVDFDYLASLRCNLNCTWCYQRLSRLKGGDPIVNEMNFEEFKSVFDKLKIKDKLVKLVGGEVFVRNDVFDILQYLKDRGAHLVTATNGLFFDTQEKIEKLKEIGPVEVTSSIDGFEDTHNKSRGNPDSFKRALNLIKEMSKAGFKTLLECVFDKSNLLQLPQILKLKEEFGVYKYRFSIPRFTTEEELAETKKIMQDDNVDINLQVKEKEAYGFSFEELMDAYKKMKEPGIPFVTHPPFFEKDPEACYQRQVRSRHKVYCTYLFRARIEPNGDIAPCPHLTKAFGNLKKDRFEDVWNSEEYREYRKKILNSNLLPVCENCAHLRIYE